MEPKFQTSFIPKKPILDAPGTLTSKRESSNIFSTISTALFVITLLVYGGMFGYKIILQNQINEADKALNDARAALETSKIQELLEANSRISAIKSLLEKHVVVSELLLLLQKMTVKNMRFTDLIYTNKDGIPSISASVESGSYNAIVQQSKIFDGTSFIQGYLFSDFSLSDNGVVKMKFIASLSPDLLSYKKVVESDSGSQ